MSYGLTKNEERAIAASDAAVAEMRRTASANGRLTVGELVKALATLDPTEHVWVFDWQERDVAPDVEYMHDGGVRIIASRPGYHDDEAADG
jgi:hypothetical protein